MTPNQQETREQLLTLFENELVQESMDKMMFVIQKRIITYKEDTLEDTLSAQEVNKIIHAVYKESTRARRKSSLQVLKSLSELLRQRLWEDPDVIELKSE